MQQLDHNKNCQTIFYQLRLINLLAPQPIQKTRSKPYRFFRSYGFQCSIL